VPVNLPASSFSDFYCQASGAKHTRIITPSALNPNSADNTEAIQTAIDDASSAGGGVVSLPTGTFLVEGHLVLKDNVTLTGEGRSTALKAGPEFLDSTGPDGGYPLITTAGASNVTIADLTADQRGNVLDADAHQGGRLGAYLIA
jgi:polygalacturonase